MYPSVNLSCTDRPTANQAVSIQLASIYLPPEDLPIRFYAFQQSACKIYGARQDEYRHRDWRPARKDVVSGRSAAIAVTYKCLRYPTRREKTKTFSLAYSSAMIRG